MANIFVKSQLLSPQNKANTQIPPKKTINDSEVSHA
jgi:hypothetical protein